MVLFRTIYISRDRKSPMEKEKIKALLSKGSSQEKVDALWQVVKEMAMGASYSDLLLSLSMCIPNTRDKRLIVLFYQYLEGIKIEDDHGNLKDEVLMVCNTIRTHLSHPNEHIRNKAIRALGRIRSPALFDSLREPLVDNITHTNPIARTSAYIALRSLLRDRETASLFEEALAVLKEQLLVERDPVCLSEGYRTLEETDPAGLIQIYTVLKNTTHEELKECFLRTAARLTDTERISAMAKETTSRTVALEAFILLIRLSTSEEEVKNAVYALLEMSTEYLDAESKMKIISACRCARSNGVYLFEGMAIRVAHMINSALARVSPSLAQDIFSFVRDILIIVETQELFGYLEKQLLEGGAKASKGAASTSTDQIFFLSALGQMLDEYGVKSKKLISAALSLLSSSLPELALGAAEYLEKLVSLGDREVLREVVNRVDTIRYGKILRKVFAIISGAADKKVAAQAVKRIGEALEESKGSVLCSLKEKSNPARIFPGVSIAGFLLALSQHAQKDEELRSEIVVLALKVYALGQEAGTLDEASKVALLKTAETVAEEKPVCNAQPCPRKSGPRNSPKLYSAPIFSLINVPYKEEVESKVQTFTEEKEAISLSQLKNTFQLSSAVDPIYCECRVTCSRAEISLDFLIVNQTDLLLEEVEMEIISSTNIRLVDSPHIGRLMPRTAHTFNLSLVMDEAGPGFIGGLITAGRMGREEYLLQNLQEIRFNLEDMLVHKEIEKEEFCEKWPLLLWENFYTATLPRYSYPLLGIVSSILKITKGTVIDTRTCEEGSIGQEDGKNPEIVVKNIFASTSQGADVFINAFMYKADEGAVVSFRIRGEKCRVVKSFCQLISQQFKKIIY